MTYDLAKYHGILLRTLDAFTRLCRREGLRYYMAFGSAIGAVRHGGIIPWDDDVDVMMPRPDYERLLSLGRDVDVDMDGTPVRYALESVRTSPVPLPFSYAKWCDTRTTVWERKRYRCVFGVFIDIFPLDGVDSVEEAERLRDDYNDTFIRYRRTFREHPREEWLSALGEGRWHDVLSPAADILLYRTRRGHYRDAFLRKEDLLSERARGTVRRPFMCTFAAPYAAAKTCCPSEALESTARFGFGGVEVDLPAGYDGILRRNYGDYMVPPPESQRVSVHHHYFVDLGRALTLEEAEDIIGRTHPSVR